MRRLRSLALAALLLTTLVACTGENVTTPDSTPGSASSGSTGSGTAGSGTAAEYQVVVDGAESLLADALTLVPAAAILKSDVRVTDLDTSRHRMLCGDTTSQYTNRVNLHLAPGTDEIAIIDAARTRYVDEGWTRANLGTSDSGGDSASSDSTAGKDPNGPYVESLKSPDGYGLSLNRAEDNDGTTILQMVVYSPCVANPADKPATWGLRGR